MGYESRIYVVDYHKRTNWGEVICMMNLCCMDPKSGFWNLFKSKVNYETFLSSGDVPTTEDSYGEQLKDAPIQEIVEWFENATQRDSYRRLAPCLAMLKGFDPKRWDDLRVVHYGY